jgi:hypothetical protein
MNKALADAIKAEAAELGTDPTDLATIMSYETGGTFNVWQKGPTTKWGRHIGLIQMGEPQRKKYGYYQGMPEAEAVKSVGRYFRDNGFKPGMGLLDMYSIVNAGAPGRYNAVDGKTTVRQKVESMGPHRRKAAAFLGDGSSPDTVAMAQAQPMGDSQVESRELGSMSLTDIDEAQQTYDPRNNPMAGGNIPFVEGNPNNVPPAEREEYTLGQLQSDAWYTESTTAWLFRPQSETEPDRNWSLTTSRMENDLAGLGADPKTYGSWLSKAHSEENYKETLDAIKTDAERNRRLSDAGATGTVLRVFNSMLDPTGLAVDAAASTLGPALVGARRAERLYRILGHGIGGAAGGLATEAVAYQVNPNKDATDMLYGSVFGFGVGGVLGALTRNPHTLTEAVNFQRTATVARQQLDGEMPAISMSGSVGAARAPMPKSFLNDEALEFTMDSDIEKSAFLKGRVDLFAQMDKSPNTLTRVGAGLVNDGVGKKGGTVNAIAASEEQQRFWTGWATSYMRTYRPALEDFRTRNTGGWRDGPRIEADFNRQVSSYIRDRRPGRSDFYDPAVVKMGNRQAALYAEVGEMANNPFVREGMVGDSVKGFERWERNQHYMMRQWDANRIVEATKDYVDGTMEQLIAGAIRKAQADMEEELIGRLAKGFTRAITNRAHGLDDAAVRAMGSEDVETLMEVLTQDGGLSRADADAVLQRFKKTSDAGDDSRAKHRLLLDESFRLPRVARKDGTVDDDGLGIEDLINMDASSNFLSYARHMSGIVALSRYRFKDPGTGELLVNGFKSDGDFEHYKQLVRRRGAELIGEGKMTREQVDKDIANLDMAYSSIRGRPVNAAENTDFGWWSRAIRKVNFTRIMNQVGFAQLSEIGATIGTLGVKAAASQVPAVRRMMSQSGETILKSGLADDLEVWLGTGTERLLHRNNYQLDETTGLAEVNAGRWRERVDGALNRVNNVTSEISGMRQANIMLERWTSASIVQKFANMAASGKGMSKARLADLGLDEAMTDRVFKMLNEPGNMEYAKGVITGRKVTRAHFGNWADKEAREAFLAAADRMSRQIIQRNDIGNMIPWMSHPAAKMLMQFRTFMVGAYTKQTLKALHFRDGAAIGSALGTMAMGGAAYVAQTKIQGIGRSDRQEWEDKRLSWTSIGTAAFARSGVSSVVPMLVDTGFYAAGQDAVFSHTRTTGQASNMLFGNPTTGGVDDVVAATRSLAGLFEDREWSQEEARQLQRITPFGNSVPIMMLLNGMISDLPEYAPRERN